MMHEAQGSCPLCGIAMRDKAKNLICDYKRYNFPYRFYFCHWHGVYVWRGKKHELFELSKRVNQAINIEPLETEVRNRFDTMPTLLDYKPVRIQCSICGHAWKQHSLKFLHSDKIVCPFCREVTYPP